MVMYLKKSLQHQLFRHKHINKYTGNLKITKLYLNSSWKIFFIQLFFFNFKSDVRDVTETKHNFYAWSVCSIITNVKCSNTNILLFYPETKVRYPAQLQNRVRRFEFISAWKIWTLVNIFKHTCTWVHGKNVLLPEIQSTKCIIYLFTKCFPTLQNILWKY